MKAWLVLLLLLSSGVCGHVGEIMIESPRVMLGRQEEVNVTAWLVTGVEAPAATLVGHKFRVSFSSEHVKDIELYGPQCMSKDGYYDCFTDREGKVVFTVIAGEDNGNVSMVVKYESTYALDTKELEFQVGEPYRPNLVEVLVHAILKFLGF